MEIKKGKMVECFAVTPNINVSWLKFNSTNVYCIHFVWLFWYITFVMKLIDKDAVVAEIEKRIEGNILSYQKDKKPQFTNWER